MCEKGAVREQSDRLQVIIYQGKKENFWIMTPTLDTRGQHVAQTIHSGHPSQSRILNILSSDWKPDFAGSSESFGVFNSSN